MDDNKDLGPYSETQMKILDGVRDFKLELLNDFMSMNRDEQPKGMLVQEEEALNQAVMLATGIANDVHKTALNVIKHTSVQNEGESAEARAEFMREISTGMSEARNNLPGDAREFIPRVDPTIVPGMLEQGIEKPTLKEILNTNIDDDEVD